MKNYFLFMLKKYIIAFRNFLKMLFYEVGQTLSYGKECLGYDI